ncbi:protein FAM184A-like [Liolophura sinensis]|uniref:protein FAM184A-like n=1 Tax=Liolophura sinensis TaxID=3198878 RepID=UPI003158E3C8
MATSAKMSFNFYQNGKYGTIPQNPSKDMEVTQDMHLKMSKKIAQLTKVIYALNTKNDEHEAVVAALKEHHEEQMQQLLAETKDKIELYKSKICNETEYRHRIESLEMCVAQYEQKRKDAFSQFETFKQQAEKRESALKTEHSEKMLALSQEVLAMKRDFEEQLQKFSDLKFDVESNQRQCIEELQKQHEQELLQLRETCQGKATDFDSERLKLEELHKHNILKLEEQYEALKSEKSKMMEDYEGKLSKAKAFYENELSVFKNAQSSSFEKELEALRLEQSKMKKDFAFQESELKQRIDSLIEQLSTSEDEISSYKQQLEMLQLSVTGKDTGMTELNKQLQAMQDEAASAQRQLKEQEAELVASRHMCSQQAQDLLNKSSLIGELEATRIQHQSKIVDLQSELAKLQDKLKWLEKERQDLESQQSTLSQTSSIKLKSLEQALEDISVEKQTMKEKYDREIKSMKERFEERERSLLSDHASQLDDLSKQHQNEVKLEKEQALKTLSDTTQSLKKKLDEETERLTREKAAVVAEFEKVKADLCSRLEAAEKEVEKLETAVKESESGLGSASVHINNLKDASVRLKQELDNSRAELKQAKANAAKLQAELDKQKLSYEAKLTAAEHDLQNRTQQLTADLEKKWTDTLSKETEQLRKDLVRQKDDEMKAALVQLAKLKDEELACVREERERQVTMLLTQISDLKNKMENSESSASQSLEKLHQDMANQKRRLEEEVKKVEKESSAKVDNLEREHREQMVTLQKQREDQLAELEQRLKASHLEEMQGQITAHKAALDNALKESEQAKLVQLGDLKAKHKHDLDTLRSQLTESHSVEIQQQTEAHQSQIHAARLELERSVEITKQKERDHKNKTEELQSEISQRERHIKNLDDEGHKLRRQLEYLSREIENKGKEISKIKVEADMTLKAQEESLRARHEANLSNLAADHLRETQEMLVEFNRAQELLKDKISELNIMLEEAEERYRLRDSRPEDLELIHQLREAVSEREGRMKALIDEKRYYQMELVNRETNFNKVFNSAPNVGVLNPLSKPKKKGSSGKFISAPNLNAWSSANRLDPLPNSPLHDEKLNPTRPLPQPNFAKKFVR